MSISTILPFLIGLGVIVVLVLGLVGLIRAFYQKVDQGTALIINGLKSTPTVSFTGGFIIPVLYRAEVMKISTIAIQIGRKGSEGLICKDNMRADIEVAFFLRVNERQEDVLRVAKAVGAARASDKQAVNELFNAKFSEALKTAGKKFEFAELFEKRQEFRDAVIEIIGKDLDGYVLTDVAIDYLEQTKKRDLDPNNIMDAEGIRKITSLTAKQNVETNELEQNEKLAITKKNTEAAEALLAMERQRLEAEAKQKREVTSIQARESAEAQTVVESERLRTERARLETEEQVEIREQEKLRQVEVAEQNRRRAVTIETERVSRAEELEKVTTNREVALQNVEREKVVEKGKMEVANVVRDRTAIEQTVAVAEEKIKETREVSEADRARQVTVLAAEAAAQEELVRTVKAAEAAAQSATHRAAEMTQIAEAELSAASKQAESKRVLAEGIKAELSAPGLAEAYVKEAQASAMEKTGVAEARVIEAKAEANYKQGNAEVRVAGERLATEAEGKTKLGEAEASATRAMGEANALATRSMGEAEAIAVGSRMKAEAEGLTEKFAAMDKMSPEARAHEELRLNLEAAVRTMLAQIEAGQVISREKAVVLAEALKSADIKMIGGDGGIFEKLTQGMGVASAVDGALQGEGLQQLVGMLTAGLSQLGGRARNSDS